MNCVKNAGVPCSIVATQIGRFIGQNEIKLTFELMDLVWRKNIIKNLGDFAVIIYSTLSTFF